MKSVIFATFLSSFVVVNAYGDNSTDCPDACFLGGEFMSTYGANVRSPPPLQYCRAEQNWTIAAKFSQGYYVKNVPVNYYNAYFRDNVWIKGASEGAPTNTTPSYRTASPYFAVESIDWESYLVRSRVIVTFSTNPIPLRTS